MLSPEVSPLKFVGLLIVLMIVGGAAGIYLANILAREPKPGHRPAPQGILMNKFKAVVCLLYVLSPIDLIPEAALGPFGLADDIVVGLVGLRAWFRKGG
mgnify:CR=1 FL=1